MARPTIPPTGVERTFGEDEIIVTKTDTAGRITYANRVFMRVAGYEEKELLGEQHNLIRHPDMPRCVFKLLWDTIGSGNEIFAYVVNQARNGDHYWVFAHVTPSFDAHGKIIGYHSNRRVPRREAVEKISPIYKQLLDVENHSASPKEGMAAATDVLVNLLKEHGTTYDQLVFAL